MRIAAVFVVISLVSAANSDETKKPVLEIDCAAGIGYPGGLPFYTAFHQQWTTRLLLVKRAKDIPELRRYLKLTDEQLSQAKELRLTKAGNLSKEQRKTLLSDNLALDEERADPKFYDFLAESLRALLDRLAVEFDGLAGLSRTSVDDRLHLSKSTRVAIESTLVEYHEKWYMPHFRANFAGTPPKDFKYRECQFAGRYLVLLNLAIQTHLNAGERRRYNEWCSATDPGYYKLVAAIKKSAPLPDGVMGLIETDSR